MELKKFFIIVAIYSFCCWTTVVAKQLPTLALDPISKEQVNKRPPVRMLEPGVFEIGGCIITKAHDRVEFPASVNMKEGLLEYLIVSTAGKLHESLLQTQIEPYALQLALLLTGLEGSTTPLSMQGQAVKPEGDLINIWLSWNQNGQEKKIPIEQWVLANNKPVNGVPWVFTGSIIVDGVFMAQVDKSIVAIYHDPSALIDHQMESGSSDEVWLVNSAAVPEVGTTVKVIIEKK